MATETDERDRSGPPRVDPGRLAAHLGADHAELRARVWEVLTRAIPDAVLGAPIGRREPA